MKGDKGLMIAIIAGGIGAVGGALFMLARQQGGAPAPMAALQGTGAVIGWQSAQRRLAGWGTPGFGNRGVGRTGAAIYWRKVA